MSTLGPALAQNTCGARLWLRPLHVTQLLVAPGLADVYSQDSRAPFKGQAPRCQGLGYKSGGKCPSSLVSLPDEHPTLGIFTSLAYGNLKR